MQRVSRQTTPFAALLLMLMLGASARAEDAPVATIKISSATSGSSLAGRHVEGLMRYRGNDYLLTLHGVERSAPSVGSVRGLVRSRDIAGTYQASDQGLRNASGVTIVFDPPLVVGERGLEIELTSRRTPKVSTGHRESGVE